MAAKPFSTEGLSLAGGNYPFVNGRYDGGTGFGEDDQGQASFSGTLSAGESHQVTVQIGSLLPGGLGSGGLGMRVAAHAKGSAALRVSLISPSGVVYSAAGATWGTETCKCQAPIIHVDSSGQWMEGTLETGVWTMRVTNESSRTARGVLVDYTFRMAYYWAIPSCPAGDLTVVRA